jgi:hypothetical protein
MNTDNKLVTSEDAEKIQYLNKLDEVFKENGWAIEIQHNLKSLWFARLLWIKNVNSQNASTVECVVKSFNRFNVSHPYTIDPWLAIDLSITPLGNSPEGYLY